MSCPYHTVGYTSGVFAGFSSEGCLSPKAPSTWRKISTGSAKGVRSIDTKDRSNNYCKGNYNACPFKK